MDGKRIGFFGASGCGKSYALKKYLKSAKDWILIDPKNEFTGAPVAHSIRQAVEYIRRTQATGAGVRLIFYPETNESAARFASFIFENAKKEMTLAVDEVQELCPSFTATRDPDNPILKISRLGRSRGLSLAVASQRIKQVDIGLRSNLNSMLLFRQGDYSDAQEIKRMTGRDLFNLPPRAFVWRSETGALVDYKNVDKLKIWF